MTGFRGAVTSAGPLCKQSAPRSRQITTTTRQHSTFTGQMLSVKALKAPPLPFHTVLTCSQTRGVLKTLLLGPG